MFSTRSKNKTAPSSTLGSRVATLLRSRAFIALIIIAAIGLAACSGGDDPADPGKWPPPDPLTLDTSGFPTMQIPGNNPTTKQGVALGRRLFYDPILSVDSTVSCATCHEYGRAFSDPLPTSVGVTGVPISRHAPQLTNAGWLVRSFWDGRAATLEDQALQPVVNPDEMGENWDNVVSKLQQTSSYPDLFGRAFGTDAITRDLVVRAVAQFERTFISRDSRFDIWLATRDSAAAGFTAEEERGRRIFDSELGDCFHCHRVNPLLTDNDFHNIGLDSPFVDLGLGDVTGSPGDFARFKTPTLRNVEVSAPYMHDGRFETLEQVVAHYNSGVRSTSTLDPLLTKGGIGLGLTQPQMDDLVAFLKTFTDPTFLNDPDLSNPFE